MNVLVGCEFSGVVRDAFTAAGHNAWSCDLLPSETPGQHYEGDVRDMVPAYEWDLLIAFPPCTYLANSGVHWLARRPERWDAMLKAAEFFRYLLCDTGIPKVALENPTMHKYALEAIGVRPNGVVQPWHFGDSHMKRTCLWLRGLPPLLADRAPTKPIEPDWTTRNRNVRVRSTTPPGLGRAMAEQWGAA